MAIFKPHVIARSAPRPRIRARKRDKTARNGATKAWVPDPPAAGWAFPAKRPLPCQLHPDQGASG
jgi:hypothetical protein